MEVSNFQFINNSVLRQNLDEAFDHIITLLPFTESKTYNNTAKSSFRKTIIIYTASIVEALLFCILDKKFTDDEVFGYYSSWRLENEKILFEVKETYKIVAGDYKKFPSKKGKEKMNLGQISNFLKDKQLINKILHKKIDVLRQLRNEQHFGTHRKVKSYSKKDLEQAFAIARKVKEFTQNNI